MRIGLINLNSINDIQFCWMTQLLVEKFGAAGARFSIPIIDESKLVIEKLPLAIADLLTDETEFDLLIFFGAENVDTDSAFLISKYRAPHVLLACPKMSETELITTTSRFEYALGVPTEVVVAPDVAPVFSLSSYPYVSPAPRSQEEFTETNRGKSITILASKQTSQADLFAVLNLLKNDDVSMLLSGEQRTNLLKMGITSPLYHYSEISLGSLLAKSGVVVDYSEELGGDVHKYILTAAAELGIPLAVGPTIAKSIHPLDCYPGASMTPVGVDMARQLRDSVSAPQPRPRWAQSLSLFEQHIESALTNYAEEHPDFSSKQSAQASRENDPTIWMAPINGSGLGHIKRLTNVASEIKDQKVRFCSFGGAIDGILGLGIDAVPLVGQVPGLANRRVQLLNFRRLTGLLKHEDCFVFDGGYPYDAIVATIESKRLRNTLWVRRGLFREDQDNREALSREKYFKKIMLPLEVFDELNSDNNAFGAEEIRVNPVVDFKERSAEDFDLEFDIGPEKRLVVTMLGGGATREVDREVFAICDELSNFDNVVHVVMDWPKSNYTEIASGFDNTHVIKTMWARHFINKAELVISAAGYNTFNEITYCRRPALYLPQSAQWLDDQERRALAAQERGIASVCRGGDFLRIRSEIQRLLGSNRAEIEQLSSNAQNLDLPEPGNASAAEIILGMLSE